MDSKLVFDNKSSALLRIITGLVVIAMGFAVAFGLYAGSGASVLGWVFAIAGAAVIAATKFISLELNKQSNLLVYSNKSTLSRSMFQVDLSAISSLDFRHELARGRRGRTYRKGVMVFIQKDGNELAVREIIPGPESAKKIADFLGLPFKVDEPISLGFVVKELANAIGGTKTDSLGEQKPEVDK